MAQPDKPDLKPGSLVSLSDEHKVIEVVSASIQNLWEAVNNLTRLQPTVRDRYRVTIFGSARVPARKPRGLFPSSVRGGWPGDSADHS